jgi:hypothetical protein
MAVMLNMKDSVDVSHFTLNIFLRFTPYNQAIALSLPASILWHVSCGVLN